MSEHRNDGGSAFPVTWFEERKPDFGDLTRTWATDGGMSLRDWFAGQYLAGGRWTGGTLEDYVLEAYAVADAMLEARGK